MKKKSIAIIMAILAVVLCFTLAACNGDKATDGNATDGNAASDLAYIQEKGKMIIGYTEFAPMNYKNDAGEFVGFETDPEDATD